MNFLALLLALNQQFIPFFGQVPVTPVVPDIMKEFFEGPYGITVSSGSGTGISGTCDLNGWESWQGGVDALNILNANYTPAIDGNESFNYKIETAKYAWLFHDINVPICGEAACQDIYGFFKIKFVTLPSAGTKTMVFRTSPQFGNGATLAIFIKDTGAFYIDDGYGNATTVNASVVGTTYYVWFRNRWASGLQELWFSSTTTKPLNGSNSYCTFNSGISQPCPFTVAIGTEFSNPNPSTGFVEFIIDRIYVSTQPIGSNP